MSGRMTLDTVCHGASCGNMYGIAWCAMLYVGYWYEVVRVTWNDAVWLFTFMVYIHTTGYNT